MHEQSIKFKKIFEEEMKYDDTTFHEFVEKIPARKAFWVGKLVEAKIKTQELENLKKELLTSKLNGKKLNIGMSNENANKALSDIPTISNIDSKLEEMKILVFLLEEIIETYRQTTFDVKHKIEIKKLELL